MKSAQVNEFKAWLQRQGAEVLAPTNPYELVRFRARGGTHIIYVNSFGRVTRPNGFAKEAFERFERGLPCDMGLTKTQRTPQAKDRAALLDRDGRFCFYCCEAMPNEDMTVEHLVPVSKGGPDHLDNKVLAHARCNQSAANLPLRKKVDLRIKAVFGRVGMAVAL